jgi:YebC/PmpR family DNA-binding regulatory protein
MAGHSKWANIKHRKGKADALKGKLFSRVTKEIISAVKQGGPDPKTNPRLKIAIQKAKEVNLPNDNIERNIKKASSSDQADYVTMLYEFYGYGGVGILAEVMTDNKNRTASEMRIATNKNGGTIATPGSVAYNFDRKGIITVAVDQVKDEDSLFLLVTDLGAEDFTKHEDIFVITTPVESLLGIKDALDQAGIKTASSEFEYIPKSTVSCDVEALKSNRELIDYLEELEDVDAVFHNMQEDLN